MLSKLLVTLPAKSLAYHKSGYCDPWSMKKAMLSTARWFNSRETNFTFRPFFLICNFLLFWSFFWVKLGWKNGPLKFIWALFFYSCYYNVTVLTFLLSLLPYLFISVIFKILPNSDQNRYFLKVSKSIKYFKLSQ